MSFLRAPKPTDHDRIIADLRLELAELSLPETLKARLLRDSDGGQHYRRILSIADLDALPPNSSYIGYKCGGCVCRLTVLVEAGNVALMNDNGVNFFLAPGYHSIPTFGVEIGAQISLSTVNRAVTCGTVGFITITEGNIGVMMLGSEYKLLAPGTYEWNSPVVGFVNAVDIRKSASQLGPFSLVTVSDGTVAVTYHHGCLRILGWSPDMPAAEGAKAASAGAANAGSSRTFFMDDPNWVHKSFLSTQIQTDRLEGNDLLSKDNVELIMVAMSQWRIVNPHLAITQCGQDMDTISTKVDQLVRATIARIVAATCIGAGPVGGHMARPVAMAMAVDGHGGDDADMAHLMQSPEATRFMAELTHNMQQMGIEVVGVYVPEKRIKNDDTRSEVSKQAVIGIKAEAQRAAADASSYATIKAAQAEAEADRARADAKAYVTVTVARADAVAIGEVAQAHARAGEVLGAPTNTAARLALSEKTGKALENARVTIFSGAPSSMMPFMFTGEPASAGL